MPAAQIRFEPAASFEKGLDRLTALYGIQRQYHDIWGRRHEPSIKVRQAILEAMGVPAGTLEEIDQALEERLWQDWSRPLAPVLVMSVHEARQAPFRLPEGEARGVAALEVHWEGGAANAVEVDLAALPARAVAEVRGRRFVEKALPISGMWPLGYHRLSVSWVDASGERRTEETRLIVCPERAFQPPELALGGRVAGLAVHLPGLRSARNWGCGDLADLEALIEWGVPHLGISFVALNPLHAIHNRQPFNTSPYLPTSSFYRNALYIDIERLEDFRASRRAVAAFNSPEVQAEISALRRTVFVEYERVFGLKLRFLKLAFVHFLRREWRHGTPRATAFHDYLLEEGEPLERFAVYSALDEWIHRRNPEIWVWQDWPAEYRDAGSEAVRTFARRHWRSVLFYKWAQWQLELQLEAAQVHARSRGMAIGLYHDLALATARSGADLWAYREAFATGCRVGSPPDDFSPTGQDWAFPPPHIESNRRSGYELFIEAIRKNCQHGGALRIDHVMRFFRLYWIPEGVTAAEGTYVHDHYQDLVRILALESVRNQVLVIGEDLGTVEPWIRDVLAAYGILSYRLLLFERREDGGFRQPAEYPAPALCAVTTHDLPTLAGYWCGRDIETRFEAGILETEAAFREQLAARQRDKQKMLEALFEAGLLPDYMPRVASHLPDLTPELHNAVVGFLASAPCQLMLLNQEDLTKETEQQNVPGTTWQQPNWRRKMRFAIEDLARERMVTDCARMFNAWVERTGRTPQMQAAERNR